MRSDFSSLMFREDGTPYRPDEAGDTSFPVVDAELAALLLPRLVEALGLALTACEIRLYALARNASAALCEQREASARKLYRERESILAGFRQGLVQASESVSTRPTDALPVVCHERHECELAFRFLLGRAEQQLLSLAQDSSRPAFPFTLDCFAAALDLALDQISLPVEAELLLYKYLERRLLAGLPRLYDEVLQACQRAETRLLAEPLSSPSLTIGLGVEASVEAVSDRETASDMDEGLSRVEGLERLSLQDGPVGPAVSDEAEPDQAEEADEPDLVWSLLRLMANDTLADEIRSPLGLLLTEFSRAGAPCDGARAEALERWLEAGAGRYPTLPSGTRVVLAHLLAEQAPELCRAYHVGAEDFLAALEQATATLRRWLAPASLAAEPDRGLDEFLGWDTVAPAEPDAADFERLAAEHQPAAPAPPPPASWTEWLSRAEPVQAKPDPSLASLAVGDWLSFAGAELPVLRCRVVACLQAPQRYLLCDRSGRKIAEATPAQLAYALEQDVLSLELLAKRMDQPLEQLIQSLRQRR